MTDLIDSTLQGARRPVRSALDAERWPVSGSDRHLGRADYGDSGVEMNSRRVLYEIHGITALPRRRSRWGTIACRGITRLLAFLKRAKVAIETEFAARSAFEELAR